jgi:hypothetical protein
MLQQTMNKHLAAIAVLSLAAEVALLVQFVLLPARRAKLTPFQYLWRRLRNDVRPGLRPFSIVLIAVFIVYAILMACLFIEFV